MKDNGFLRHLLGQEGVVAVVTFGDYGELLGVEGSLDPSSARLLAFLLTAVNVNLSLHSEVMERTSGIPFHPFTGWIYRGRDYSLIVSGHYGLVVRNALASYDRLVEALEEVQR